MIAGRPDVAEENRLALLVVTERGGIKVKVHSASKSVGNNERRRSQVVGTGVRMDTSLEVSVSGEDSGGDHITINNGVLNAFWDLTRVTDAGHATIASSCEAKLIHVLTDASGLVVLGNDVGAGGERLFDVRLGAEALFNGILGEKTSGEHDIRV